MSEKKQIIMFLLTRDVAFLPENYPDVDRKKWLKKNDLQRMREVKRIAASIIDELKLDETSANIQTSYITSTRNWCPPHCV